jgi:hypothetical protein
MLISTITISLSPNFNKRKELHPDLTGSLTIDGRNYDIADWIRTTMDGLRQYHSVNITDELERKAALKQKRKAESVAKFKMYETRKKLVTDPDFYAKEPFVLAGVPWYSSLTVRDTDSDDLEALNITLTLSREAVRQAPSSVAVDSLTAFKERLAERERERQKRLEKEAEDFSDDTGSDGNNHDPDELPF